MDELLTWAAAHGARVNGAIEVYPDPVTGYSFRVKAGASLPANEAIVELPAKLSLSYLNALATPSPLLPKSALGSLPPHVVGRLFLAAEYLRGTDSFWAPYIATLPQPTDRDGWALPPFWYGPDAELLEGTNVEVGISKILADVRGEWEAFVAVAPADTPLTMGLYQWAYCIFSSRSFRPSLVLPQSFIDARKGSSVSADDFSVLLPVFDIGNHDMTSPASWVVSPSSCELRVNRAHAAGEQVFNNYSPKTNAELLLGYGFMIDSSVTLHNDYTHVRKRGATAPGQEYLISLRPLDDASSLLGRARTDLVLKEEDVFLASFRHVQPDMAWDIFCVMRGVEPTGDEQAMRDFLAGRVAGEDVSLLQQTVAVIQHKMLQELERLEETERGQSATTRNGTLALDYRRRCRDVLEAVLTAMTEDIEAEDEEQDA